MSLEEEDCVPSTDGERLRGCARAADAPLTPPPADLSLMEKDILKDWKAKFDVKYAKVGTVKKD